MRSILRESLITRCGAPSEGAPHLYVRHNFPECYGLRATIGMKQRGVLVIPLPKENVDKKRAAVQAAGSD